MELVRTGVYTRMDYGHGLNTCTRATEYILRSRVDTRGFSFVGK